MSSFIYSILLETALATAYVLWVDWTSTKQLEEMHKSELVETNWEIEYRETSEDHRQYKNLTWQLPSAVFVADGLAIGFAYSKDFRANAPFWASSAILFAALGFNAIMLHNFLKFGYRAYSRFRRMMRIEQVKEIRRLGPAEPTPFRWGSWRWMAVVLVILSGILAELAFSALGW